jgi:NitT/TauT family transport system permease protein
MNSLAQPKKWEKLFWPVLASALFLALRHYTVVWTATKVFPSPLAVEKGLAELVRKGLLWADIGDSLRRVALGFGAAAALGVPLGLTLGWYPAANQAVNPLLQMLRPISPIAWIPVAIILFRVGDMTPFSDLPGRFLPHRVCVRKRRIQCAVGVPACRA